MSVSNLFKQFNTSNGFVVQVPLELPAQRWNIVVLDLLKLFQKSQLFPQSYKLEGAHALKSITLCANCIVRGVFTSDNLYDYSTLPSDMQFKFGYNVSRWEEFFAWQSLPLDWETEVRVSPRRVGLDEVERHKKKEEEKKHMEQELDQLLKRRQGGEQETQAQPATKKKSRGLP